MNYRFKHTVNVIRFPKGEVDEDRGLKECCTILKKLAHPTDTDNWKNDVTGVTVKKSAISDTVTFVVTKCGVELPLLNLGDQGIYPQDPLAFGFIFDWQQYLNTIGYGIGTYTISVEFTISGVVGGYVYGKYELQEYSIESAAECVRVWSEPSTYSELELIDYTGSNVRDCIRFSGLFGEMQPKTVINNLITKGRRSEKVTRENLIEYSLRTNPINYGITKRLINFHFLNEDTLLISDHSAFNHTYQLFDKEVVLEETAEMEYIQSSRLAKLSAKFGKRKKLDKSYYNLQ